MIAQLRTQACSGDIHDLAHVSTEDCLSDCLTKSSAKSDNLRLAVATGTLKNIDKHPPFRSLVQHKAFYSGPLSWCCNWIRNVPDSRFLNVAWEDWDVGEEALCAYANYPVSFMNWRLHSADDSYCDAYDVDAYYAHEHIAFDPHSAVS